MKRIRRKFYYILTLLFSKFVLLLPLKAMLVVGAFLGRVSYYLLSSSRNRCVENLKNSFPNKDEREIRRIAKAVFANQGKNLFELLSLQKLSAEFIKKSVKIENRNVFDNALKPGKGVLIASAHCGNWEIMGAALSVNGFPINVIARKIYIDGLNDLLVKLRSSKGVNVILRSQSSSAKEILRSLRNNEAIGILIDQDTSVPGVYVDFFSRPAWTPSGLAALALRTGAEIILALDVRCKDDSHKVILEGPFELQKTKDIQNDIFTNTAFITKKIEDHVSKYPEQWVWMHERWKTQKNDI